MTSWCENFKEPSQLSSAFASFLAYQASSRSKSDFLVIVEGFSDNGQIIPLFKGILNYPLGIVKKQSTDSIRYCEHLCQTFAVVHSALSSQSEHKVTFSSEACIGSGVLVAM